MVDRELAAALGAYIRGNYTGSENVYGVHEGQEETFRKVKEQTGKPSGDPADKASATEWPEAEAVQDSAVADSFFSKRNLPPPEYSRDQFFFIKMSSVKSFSETFYAMIDEHGLSDEEICNRAKLNRNQFSKIHSFMDYHPSKQTVIELAFVMGLSISEAEKLLRSAGRSLSFNRLYDVIIRFFFECGIYDMDTVNAALDYYGQPLLP